MILLRPIFFLLALSVCSGGFAADKRDTAIFAGGCFWCMEPPFDAIDGVTDTTSGYIGGHSANPTYETVSAGNTGHTEAVRITFDPARVDYQTLLEVFWRNIDPLDGGGQFCDRGSQYRSGIFTLTKHQMATALDSKKRLADSRRLSAIENGDDIATEIVAAGTFYPAEEYHQNYYQRNPLRYKYYRRSCGRDQRLEAIWGKPHP